MANNFTIKDASLVTRTVKSTETGGVHTQHVNIENGPGSDTAPSITAPFSSDALTNTVQAVKASPGKVFFYHIYNPNTVDIFVHFYDLASGSVTVGSSTRYRTLCIPAKGVLDTPLMVPWEFAVAISIAATTTITGTTAPTTGLLVTIDK